jgi:ergothioneine biosynthesis glutamate--cysteine ligase EgtA
MEVRTAAEWAAPAPTRGRCPTGPDLEGEALSSLIDVGLRLDSALEHVAGTCLRPAAVGRVGLELEAHAVDLGAPEIRVPWTRIRAVVDALPPLPGGSRVTLEPGGQVELSGPPCADVVTAVRALRGDRAAVDVALAAEGLGLASLGADPLRRPSRTHPGARYAAMEEHFRAVGCGAAGAAMMTSTASLQVNLEAGPPDRWAARVALAHQVGPVLVAVSACSPLLADRATGWRSSRQQVWGDLDQARCGPLLEGTDPAAEWAGYALAAPVMLIRDPQTGDAEHVRDRTSFADWVTGDVALGGRRPTTADLDYHLTTLFPPVRLRGYLEIRYLDATPEPWWPALASVTTTLLDEPAAAARAAAAAAPVVGWWDRAARLGLADPSLHEAARGCMAAALDHAPTGLRAQVQALAELVDRGASPGDAVLRTALREGPAAALLNAARLPEVRL